MRMDCICENDELDRMCASVYTIQKFDDQLRCYVSKVIP